jgi:hypothetical protein
VRPKTEVATFKGQKIAKSFIFGSPGGFQNPIWRSKKALAWISPAHAQDRGGLWGSRIHHAKKEKTSLCLKKQADRMSL